MSLTFPHPAVAAQEYFAAHAPQRSGRDMRAFIAAHCMPVATSGTLPEWQTYVKGVRAAALRVIASSMCNGSALRSVQDATDCAVAQLNARAHCAAFVRVHDALDSIDDELSVDRGYSVRDVVVHLLCKLLSGTVMEHGGRNALLGALWYARTYAEGHGACALPSNSKQEERT